MAERGGRSTDSNNNNDVGTEVRRCGGRRRGWETGFGARHGAARRPALSKGAPSSAPGVGPEPVGRREGQAPGSKGGSGQIPGGLGPSKRKVMGGVVRCLDLGLGGSKHAVLTVCTAGGGCLASFLLRVEVPERSAKAPPRE